MATISGEVHIRLVPDGGCSWHLVPRNLVPSWSREASCLLSRRRRRPADRSLLSEPQPLDDWASLCPGARRPAGLDNIRLNQRWHRCGRKRPPRGSVSACVYARPPPKRTQAVHEKSTDTVARSANPASTQKRVTVEIRFEYCELVPVAANKTRHGLFEPFR